MKAQVVNLSPMVAKNILQKNIGNRSFDEKRVNEYSRAMKLGHWKENGESIIIDKNGIVKDGQHRLMAIIKANKNYNVVVVSDVDPNVMQTIDIGKNRSLKDVLDINGVKNTSHVSSIILKIFNYKLNNKATYAGTSGNLKMTNSDGLSFYYDNKEELDELTKIAVKIYGRQTYKLLGVSDIGLYHYIVYGFRQNEVADAFLNNLCGVINNNKNATSWLNKKIWNAKKNKVFLNRKWIVAMVIKSWNSFVDGDPEVSHMTFNVDSDLPTPTNIKN